MATARLVEVDGAGQEEYDRMVGITQVLTNPPKGMLLHVAAPRQGGWRVFDVWDSEESFREYERNRLLAAFKQAGLELLPRTDLYRIHNVAIGDRNRLMGLASGQAVVQLVDVAGMSVHEYDRVISRVWTGGTPPHGSILHTAGPSSTGWRVLNIWTTEQTAREFRTAQLDDAFRQLGITAQPKIDFNPVYKCKVTDIEALTKLRERTMHA